MIPRPVQKLNTFVDFSRELAKLSCCRRAQCGAVIFTPNFSEVLAIGYNSPPCGQLNDACTEAEGACGCIHAEANSVIKLRDRSRKHVMYATTMPCPSCAGLIVNCKAIGAVIWGQPYRTRDGLDVLRDAGVHAFAATDARDMGDELVAVLRNACE